MYPHHFTPDLLKLQADAIGIPIILKWTTGKNYTKSYIDMLRELKKQGVTGGVFGDVSVGNPDAQEHRRWVQEVCKTAGMDVYLPLWDEDRESIISEIIDSGFKPLIIAADDKDIGRNWLGKTLDQKMLTHLKLLHQNSQNGEVGLYHTFVVDGPLFKHRIELSDTEIVYRKYGLYDGKPTLSPFWYLDIKNCNLIEKPTG
jgi:uncharacterized protein (TIGR00290 family)